ncbi:MAG: N,N-dimethylformamidase beta subunit family domain-containing protein [Gaiellaceae bacterium]
MRASFVLLPLFLAALLAGSVPAAVAPPRLLGLSISNGGHPFLGDTRQLATVSPNGDGYRDRAIIRFRLDRPATVYLEGVATGETRHRGKIILRMQRRFAAGPHRIVWKPRPSTADRTYLFRFTVAGHGGTRVYGFEPPRRQGGTSGLVVRVQSVDVAFLQSSYPVGGREASVSIATDARTIRLQFLSYATGRAAARDAKTSAGAITPSVRLDWRSHRDSPHVVGVSLSGTWTSGLYFLRVTAGDGRVGYAPFILRPRRLGEHKVAVVFSTNTWQAYNFRDSNGDGWGDSWYISGATRRVDLRRPFLDSGLPFRFRAWDLPFFSWLNRTDKKADYFSDDDLAGVTSGDALRRAYDLLVFPEHEEYVTRHAYEVVQRFRDLGGNLLFLSSNNFFWKVQREGPFLRKIQQWRKLGRPEAGLVGAQYVASNQGTPQSPYVVQGASSEPWVFTGTGLVNGSSFGRYGVEVDERTSSSPAGTVVLARIPDAIGSHDAEMTFYRTPAGAKVFDAGALDFAGSLGLPAVSRLVENLWARLAAP